jgi:hypothetical protein
MAARISFLEHIEPLIGPMSMLAILNIVRTKKYLAGAVAASASALVLIAIEHDVKT